jgi:hypothetical protein
MEPKQKRGRWIALGLGVGLIVAWGGYTVADAVIPAPGGVIKACYKKRGNLRVIDSTASCKPGKETAIQWNQTGSQGPDRPVVTNRNPWNPLAPAQPLISGELVAQNATLCSSVVGYPCTHVLGASWTEIGSFTIGGVDAPATLDVRYSGGSSCFGPVNDARYIRLKVDGKVAGETATLTTIPAVSTGQVETNVSLERTVDLSTSGTHTIGIEVWIDSGSVCALGWDVIAEAI